MTMRKIFLLLSRFFITRIPKGKSRAIVLALKLFGSNFNDVITTRDGRKFYINKITAVNRDLFFLNNYESFETELVKKIVKTGDYVLDIGSSFGWYSTLMSRLVGDSGKVFAFELVPEIVDECKKNIHLNNLNNNITVENIALGEKEGEVKYVYSENVGLGNLRAGTFRGSKLWPERAGFIMTLDNYLEKHGINRVDFIKCDIDGAEVPFLKGANRTLTSRRPIIIIEVSDWAQNAHGHLCSELFGLINKLEYTFFSLHTRHELKIIEPKDFTRNFKEDVLCLPKEKLNIVELLKSDKQ